MSVLSNSKEDALNRVFGDASSGKSGTEQSTGLKELTRDIIDEVRRLPGNNICCDCDATGMQRLYIFFFWGGGQEIRVLGVCGGGVKDKFLMKQHSYDIITRINSLCILFCPNGVSGP